MWTTINEKGNQQRFRQKQSLKREKQTHTKNQQQPTANWCTRVFVIALHTLKRRWTEKTSTQNVPTFNYIYNPMKLWYLEKNSYSELQWIT